MTISITTKTKTKNNLQIQRQMTDNDFDRRDRQSKRDITASTITYFQGQADDGIVKFYECKNDSKEVIKALKRGDGPTLVFVPFDSPEAFKGSRADVYVSYIRNGKELFFGIECKESGYPIDYEKKLTEGVYCGPNKLEFFRLIYGIYGIPYYWAELYDQGKIRIWNLNKMGYLDDTADLPTKQCRFRDVFIDPDSPIVEKERGLLNVHYAWLVKRKKGENVYDRQYQDSRGQHGADTYVYRMPMAGQKEQLF